MREENGFSLIAAIAAIAIPNLIQTRMAANHSSAAASMPCRLHAMPPPCHAASMPMMGTAESTYFRTRPSFPRFMRSTYCP